MFMKKQLFTPIRKCLLIISVTLILTACSRSLDGTYSNGMIDFKFESGGKAYMSSSFMGVRGAEMEVQYEVDGDKVKIIMPQGNQILRLQKDGTLSGPGGAYTKKQ